MTDFFIFAKRKLFIIKYILLRKPADDYLMTDGQRQRWFFRPMTFKERKETAKQRKW